MTVAPVAATALPVTILALETGNFYDFIMFGMQLIL
jgi:hypothetical protein